MHIHAVALIEDLWLKTTAYVTHSYFGQKRDKMLRGQVIMQFLPNICGNFQKECSSSQSTNKTTTKKYMKSSKHVSISQSKLCCE